MERVVLVYNPYSGKRRFKYALDDFVDVMQHAKYMTHVVRATNDDVLEATIKSLDESYSAVVVAGGDGTVNFTLNALKRHNKDIPLGILPVGTANGFSSCIKMPTSPRIASEAIIKGRVIAADLGLANNRYFINSSGGGLFTNVSHDLTLDTKSKRIFGKTAYIMKGMAQLLNIKPLPLRITTPKQIIEEEFSVFITLNSRNSGSFSKMAPDAQIDDGLLEFVAFRATSLKDLIAVYPKILRGTHLNDRRVLYLRESSFKIEYIGKRYVATDVDGERGPDFPLNITCEKGAQSLIVPALYDRYPRQLLAESIRKYKDNVQSPAKIKDDELIGVAK